MFFRMKKAEAAQGSVGAGIGMAVVNAMIASNMEAFMKTNVNFDNPQPTEQQLREAIGPIQR
jgi:hypothetical protein